MREAVARAARAAAVTGVGVMVVVEPAVEGWAAAGLEAIFRGAGRPTPTYATPRHGAGAAGRRYYRFEGEAWLPALLGSGCRTCASQTMLCSPRFAHEEARGLAAERPLSPAALLRVLRDTASALHYLHSCFEPNSCSGRVARRTVPARLRLFLPLRHSQHLSLSAPSSNLST